MKPRMFCILVVLALVTVSFAQRHHDVGALVMVEPTSVTFGQDVHLDLSVTNSGARNVTIREVELYCGTNDHSEWYEVLSIKRLTVEGGETFSVDLDYHPTCAGTWNVQCILRFGGGGKNDLMTPPKEFNVY